MRSALSWGGVLSLAALVTCRATAETSLKPDSAPSFQIEGFATINGYGLNGTIGGGNAPVITVRTAAELQAAVERSELKKNLRDNTPRVIRIAADIDLGDLGNERPGNELK